MRKYFFAVSVLLSSSLAFAQQPKPQQTQQPQIKTNPLSMERYEGGSVKTNLGYNIILNKDSNLKREWFVLKDAKSPVSINEPAGINVIFKGGERSSSSEYQYFATFDLTPNEPVTAVEVRIHILDVFGQLLKTLSMTKLRDFDIKKSFDGTWRIWSENEASEAYVSIIYVAKVRTASGVVYEIDKTAVLDQIRKISKRITEADLEPKHDSPKP